MRILFSNLPWWPFGAGGELLQGIRAGSRWPFTRPAAHAPDQFRFGGYLPYPFFLGSAAAYVQRAIPDARVVFRDSVARGESYGTFLRALSALRPDAIVVEVGAASWSHDRDFLRMLRKVVPGLRIAVAGPTAAQVASDGEFDAYLVGEYEKTSLAFADGASGKLGFDMLTRAEMNALPYPMTDDGCALNYWDACPSGQKAPHLQLFTSRGCPHKCCFCAWPATMTGDDPDGTKPRSVRFHSAEWVEGMIRDFIGCHPETQCIYLDDDTFNLADKHTLAICEVMKRIGLPWSAMCRADTSTREAWMAMRDSGCFGVKLGFESGSQRVVDEIVNKKLDLKEAEETARWLRSIGMSVHGTFTIGLPGETPAEANQTKAFIRRLHVGSGGDALDTFQLSGTATIEGTPLDRIAHGETLKAFPGAKRDGFVVDADGNRKAAHL